MRSARMCSLKRPSNTAIVSNAIEPHTSTGAVMLESFMGRIYRVGSH
ncbi:Uncharacterised protein [Bordetella pertussis]|nr:Uncharacterised protein [Bordetella pertussis]